MTPRPLAAFLVRLIWLSVLPLVLAAAWLAIDHVQTLQDETRLQATNLAQNFATAIDHHLNARIRALNMLAVSPLADTPQRWSELYVEAQGFRESFGSHVILADTFEPMQMLFNTRSPFGAKLPTLPRPQGYAAAPAALATGKPAVGDTFMGPIAKEPLIAIAVPGMRDGHVAHILLTILETKQFQHRLDQESIPQRWALTLKDGLGDIIAQRAPAGFDARRDVDADGRFESASSLSHWKVVLEIPRDALRAPLFSAGLVLALVIVIATVAGVLGGTLAGRRLGRQVAALATPPAPGRPPLDITEIVAVRRMLDDAAASLHLSETRFETTIEQATMGIALVDLEGRYLLVNRAVSAMLGYSREELLAMTWQQLTPPDELKTDLENLRQLIAREIPSYTREKRFIAKDGTIFWANLGVTLIRTIHGEPDYFIAVMEDIRARKNVEAALVASEQRYRELVENANSAIVHWAQDGTITFFNTYAQHIFLWNAEEIIGKHVGVLVPERESTGADLSELVRNIATHPERYQQVVNENVRRDGSRLWMNWTNRALRDEQGRVTSILAVGIDISELKRIEDELKRRNEELECFNQASVGRELRMIDLKRQINDLSRQLGQPPSFDLSFLGDS